MKTKNRPDLSNTSIAVLLILAMVCFLIILLVQNSTTPGSILGQSSAAFGVVFLLTPFLFSIMKRSGLSESPPSWFVAHVLMSLIGFLLIAIHVRSGNWLTPPGFVLFCLFLLLFQGAVLRVVLSKKLSLLFAQSSQQHGFSFPVTLDKNKLKTIIDHKVKLLQRLDSSQDEALFSPALKHWFWHPILSTRYQLLADKEAKLVGIKQYAGFVMSWSRRLHMLVAFLFFAGLVSHIIIMLFFAGYAADGGAIEWWHITAWGG